MVRQRQRGLALLLVLLAVAVIGLIAASALQAGAQVTRRDAEDELLVIGQTFQQAVLSYVNTTPGQAALGPRSLDDLLRDPRVPGLRRHLRQIPHDPMTGRTDWGLLKSPDGQIIGIFSLAEGQPIKRAGFEPALARLTDAPNYQAWVFGPALPPTLAASRPAIAAERQR
jgi:type II secretory pathway pseudopilin PulG